MNRQKEAYCWAQNYWDFAPFSVYRQPFSNSLVESPKIVSSTPASLSSFTIICEQQDLSLWVAYISWEPIFIYSPLNNPLSLIAYTWRVRVKTPPLKGQGSKAILVYPERSNSSGHATSPNILVTLTGCCRSWRCQGWASFPSWVHWWALSPQTWWHRKSQ